MEADPLAIHRVFVARNRATAIKNESLSEQLYPLVHHAAIDGVHTKLISHVGEDSTQFIWIRYPGEVPKGRSSNDIVHITDSFSERR